MDKKVDMFIDIIEFHKKFELEPHSNKSKLLPTDIQVFREKFLEEELVEFKNAYINNDLEGAFDALIDLIYVALGTAYLMGLPFNDGWNEVHKCNLQKIRARNSEDSKRNSTYDVIKPDGWQPPDLKKYLDGDK